VFNFESFSYENKPRQKIAISMCSIKLVARLLEIVQIALQLQQSGESITKRNLYYKLIAYYASKYYLLDSDLDLLCCNLALGRDHINIVSSSRCLLFGEVLLRHSHGTILCQHRTITSITTHLSQFEVQTSGKVLLIVEKESALYQIHQQFLKRHEGGHPSRQALESMIVVASKGYPDNTTRKVIEALLPLVDEVFYLGDCDIYGLDILLCYTVSSGQFVSSGQCVSSGQFGSYFERVKWVQLGGLVEEGRLEGELLPQSKEDKLKCIEILERPYFKNIELHLPHSERGERCKAKLIAWKEQLKRMQVASTKFELESLFKLVDEGWIDAMLHGQHYL
jgi:DNA topoisomerase VI subunit A